MRRLGLYAYLGALVAALLVAFGLLGPAAVGQPEDVGRQNVAPKFQVDPNWPKPLPNDWILGQVAGVAVDADDHVWIVQRPGSLDPTERGLDEGTAMCCRAAPPVMEFDSQGNLLQAWGGPGEGFDWPENEHGLFVDHLGNVWIAGNGTDDHQVLKFSHDGTFLLQIGEAGVTGGDSDTEHLGRPADTMVDPDTNEVYVADGYLNRRVIVFDADTGEFRRMWGAGGVEPTDPANDFGNPVHCVFLTEDDLVYVCDRPNNRVQVFQEDGTFLREFTIRPETLGLGSAWDVDASTDRRQTFLYDADGTNNVIWILRRATEEVLTHFGRHGRYAGQFHWVHNVAVDSKGNIYTAEVDNGKRAQKFEFRGHAPIGR